MAGRSLPPRRRSGRLTAILALAACLWAPVAVPAALAAGSKKSSSASQTSSAQPTATAATSSASPAGSANPTGSAGASGIGGTSSNPLSGGVTPISPAPTPTTTSASSTLANSSTASSGASSLSTASALLILVAAIALIGGIAFFIWRDARRRAPMRTAEAAVGSAGRRTGSKAPPKPRKLSAAERKRRKRGRAR